MKKLSLAIVLILAISILHGCISPFSVPEQTSVPTSALVPTSSPIREASGKDLLKTEAVLLDEDVGLSLGEQLVILDVYQNLILCAVERGIIADEREGGSETKELLLYDMESKSFCSKESLEGVIVIHGTLYNGGYVFTALEAGPELLSSGYVRSCGDIHWEYPLEMTIKDWDGAPKPYILATGETILIVPQGLYYKPRGEGELAFTCSEALSVICISPEGSAKTIFEPDADAFFGYTQIETWHDQCVFRMGTEHGNEFYVGGPEGFELAFIVDSCRGIFNGWVVEGQKFLLYVGYGDEVHGNTSYGNMIINEELEAIPVESNVSYARMASDGNGRILGYRIGGVPSETRVYSIRIEGTQLAAAFIDLPGGYSSFFSGDDGNMYVRLTAYTNTSQSGLYRVIFQGDNA